MTPSVGYPADAFERPLDSIQAEEQHINVIWITTLSRQEGEASGSTPKGTAIPGTREHIPHRHGRLRVGGMVEASANVVLVVVGAYVVWYWRRVV